MKKAPLNKPLHEAVVIAGGQSALARALGVKQGQVWEWLFVSGRPTPGMCPATEAHTGVTCESLRPDLEWERDDLGRVTGYRVPLPPVNLASEALASAEQ